MVNTHVAVLMGGWSPERSVSLLSGGACADALVRLGYRVSRVDVDHNLAQTLSAIRPDAVFNMLHGGVGGNGTVQAVLELCGLPYTHSGVTASVLAARKDLTKIVLANSGIRVPSGFLASRLDAAKQHLLPAPYVVKPIAEGSSLGIQFVMADTDPPPCELASNSWAYGDSVLCEPFIPGRELACGVMGGRPLPVVETIVAREFNDANEKFAEEGSVTLLPAPLPKDIYEEIQEMSVAAHHALGCRGVTRCDFRFDPTRGRDGIFCLELNNQPGMTRTSLVPEMAEHEGISFDELVSWIIEDASLNR